jgi:hypothetical protein
VEISKENLYLAASKVGIPLNQVEALWITLASKEENVSSFSKMIYYLGALIVISSMTWLLGLSWELFEGGALFLISITYAGIFAYLGSKLWKREGLRIPAGLLITMAVCMTPLAIYGMENYLNIWPQDTPDNYRDFFHRVQGHWILMEIGTVITGLIAVYFYSFPFLMAPIFFSAWFFTMDILPLILGKDSTWEQREWISLCFGLIMMGIAYFIDRKQKEDYGFWGYFFGTLTFWLSLSGIMWVKSDLVIFLYFVLNIVMIFLSIPLRRKILLVCGALGVASYFGYLAYDLFQDSVAFPFVLSFIGLLIIFLGIAYQKNYPWLEQKMRKIMPSWFNS